ncbi:protein-tyrosine kinase 6-like isoform X1 [Megalops cyprinoides]|uniref:protein-tyrosine kinase 6-like isoform X1 n=1 Tax=Megalops cyprinoides TaxID=118141 RepID=UPI001865124A|nr:protein-tyrosine kinase 6-like isoform X1 [Megalops cyprinoides]
MSKVCPSPRTLCSKLFGGPKVDDEDSDPVGVQVTNTNEDKTASPNQQCIACKSTQHNPSSPQATTSVNGAQVYKALWSFEARAEEELSFQEGDYFKIIGRSGDWWTAGKLDRNGHVLAKGFVPYNYLARKDTVEAQPWFFGKLNRLEALRHLLSPENGDGAFLVRLSEKDHVGCVLSVKDDGKVRHFKVVQTEDGQFYLDHNQRFRSLMELVDYYHSHPLASIPRLRQTCARTEPKPHDLSHSTVDEWELPKEEFTLEEQLGSGYFADVFRGKWKNRINVAIKILKNKEALNQRDFQLETQILKRLRHRHLISLFAICSIVPPYYIITELMEKGNLLSFLRGKEGQRLDVTLLVDMAIQVADGMAYLESQHSIHRDLAARNVLVGENYICKVADFGLARVIKEPFYVSEDKKIPYKWCAPEAISHGRFSNKSDVWSFGVLMYEILTYGGIPYPAYTNHEVFRLITSGYRMPAPSRCPEPIYSLMLSCWSLAPEERPDFSDLKADLVNINRYEMD